jgi:hypothetical protein
VIPPGGEGEIKAVLRTKGRSGTTKKRITVMSNDPETPNLSLELSGEIVVDVAVKPRHLSFGQVGKGESGSREFELKVTDPDKVKIVDVSASDEMFVLERISGEPAGDSKYSLKLTDTKTIGRITGKVIIKLEGSENDTIEVPIRATVVGDLRYSRSVYFNKREGEFPERDIVFTRRSGKDVLIKGAEDPEGHLKLEVATAKGDKATVKATVADPGKDYTKPVRGMLKVQVQDKDEPVVEIRYTVTDRPRSKMRGLRSRPMDGPPAKSLRINPKGEMRSDKEAAKAPKPKPE